MMVLFTTPRGGDRAPRGKKADVTLQFTEGEGPILNGLELCGLSIWERRDGSGLFVSLPGREYMDGDKKKTYDFLRYTAEADKARHDQLKQLILEQYQDWANAGR